MDAARGFKAGFYWLAPMVANPAVSGTFDPTLSPVVTVCRIVGDNCGTVIATFTTTTGPGSETVRVDAAAGQYQVNWHTDLFSLVPSDRYRISVLAGSNVLLGYADIQPVSSGKEVRAVDGDQFIPLVNGRTLPIKFRIEQGVVAAVAVSPATITLAPGATTQFSATVTDLHGNVLARPVSWTTSQPNVATVNAAGVVSGIGGGTAQITATVDRAEGAGVASVPTGPVFRALALGHHAICALDTQDRRFCWGGWLYGTVSSPVPYYMYSPARITQLAFGLFHECGLIPTGAMYCAGGLGYGELGNGSLAGSSDPVSVTGGHTYTAVAVGRTHSCGLTNGGQAYCWGWNRLGPLGDGNFGFDVMTHTPQPVVSDARFVAITAGPGHSEHTCALTASGQVHCWGDNGGGQLGNGSFANPGTPVLVTGGHQFTQISAGQGFTCGITTTGATRCWGDGFYGSLGNGGTSVAREPVEVSGGHAFVSVASGAVHACGLTANGTAYCWGGNGEGQLGDGTLEQRTTPVLVNTNARFVLIAGGTDNTCALTAAGQAYCWGRGNTGQIGDGNFEQRLVPTAVLQLPSQLPPQP